MARAVESSATELGLGAVAAVRLRERASTVTRLTQLLLRNKMGLIGFIILAGLTIVAVIAPLISPYDPLAQETSRRLKWPMWSDAAGNLFLLGTDQLGRDILSRMIFGSRISLSIGVAAVAIATPLGCAIGIIAGYYGGWVDDVMMRVADIQLAFPFILLAIAVVAVLGASIANIIVVLGLVGWVLYARLVRSDVMGVRNKEFVEAARAIGARDYRIMFRHILPNVLTPVIIMSTFHVANTIITESTMSYLGLGVQPPEATWGGMLSDGKEYITTAWWLSTFPGLAIMVCVLAINFVGDWLRDLLDPRVQL